MDETRILIRYEVRPSPIHGLGLFSLQYIPKDSVIDHFEVEKSPDLSKFIGSLGYVDVTWKEIYLITNDLKYVNSSRYPNSRIIDRFTLVALRDIPAGEEITLRYLATDWENP